MTSFLQLAERVEQAKGPARELDAEICCVAGPLIDPRWVRSARPSDNRAGMVIRYFNDGRHGTCVSPRFTSSVDSAMTLAVGLEQFGGAAAMLRQAMDNARAHYLYHRKPEPKSSAEFTQVLARFVTAACLRAHAAKEDRTS